MQDVVYVCMYVMLILSGEIRTIKIGTLRIIRL